MRLRRLYGFSSYEQRANVSLLCAVAGLPPSEPKVLPQYSLGYLVITLPQPLLYGFTALVSHKGWGRGE